MSTQFEEPLETSAGIEGLDWVWMQVHRTRVETAERERDEARARCARYEDDLRYIAGYDVAGYSPHMGARGVASSALAREAVSP